MCCFMINVFLSAAKGTASFPLLSARGRGYFILPTEDESLKKMQSLDSYTFLLNNRSGNHSP